jgi:hypothetical protein
MTKKRLKTAGPSRLNCQCSADDSGTRSRGQLAMVLLARSSPHVTFTAYISHHSCTVMWTTETRRVQTFYPVLILKPQFQLCSIQINRLLSYFNNATSTEKIIRLRYYYVRSCWSAVCIATGYWLDDRGVGVRVPVGSRIFSSPRRSDRLWGSPSLSDVHLELFPRG